MDQPNGPATEDLGQPRVFMDAILTGVANHLVDFHLAEQRPVLPAVHATQSPDLYVNENGQAMLIYREKLPGEVWWTEYDPELRRLVFVTLSGQIFDFGMAIHDIVDFFLQAAGVIYLVQIDAKGKIVNIDERKLVVRKS